VFARILSPFGTQATPMTDKKLDPRVSEFETEEQAASYDRWFRAKVQASLDDPSPPIPHDEVMAQVRATIARIAAAK
jgi:hypothetical protein